MKDPNKAEVKYQMVPDPREAYDEDTPTELEYTNVVLEEEGPTWDLHEER